jgi:hypothetical protein
MPEQASDMCSTLSHKTHSLQAALPVLLAIVQLWLPGAFNKVVCGKETWDRSLRVQYTCPQAQAM